MEEKKNTINERNLAERNLEKTNLEKPNLEWRNLNMTYKLIIGALILVIFDGILFYAARYNKDVAEAKAEYTEAKMEYDEAYARIIEEEQAWEAELTKTHNEAISVAAELSEIYDERQAEHDAEDARWNSLSKEAQEVEKKCIAYNEMVSYLRANNEEYANIYSQYATYLGQDIFNLDKSTLLEYTDLYSKKAAIEMQYMEENPLW